MGATFLASIFKFEGMKVASVHLMLAGIEAGNVQTAERFTVARNVACYDRNSHGKSIHELVG